MNINITSEIEQKKEYFNVNLLLLKSKKITKTISRRAVMIRINKYQSDVILINPFFKNISRI